MFSSIAQGLALLKAINTAEADGFGEMVVQDFNRIAIEDGAVRSP